MVRPRYPVGSASSSRPTALSSTKVTRRSDSEASPRSALAARRVRGRSMRSVLYRDPWRDVIAGEFTSLDPTSLETVEHTENRNGHPDAARVFSQ